jgi:hypothetical protein
MDMEGAAGIVDAAGTEEPVSVGGSVGNSEAEVKATVEAKVMAKADCMAQPPQRALLRGAETMGTGAVRRAQRG